MARFSVVVSALDEQADLGRSLRAIGRATQAIRTDAEVIVVVCDRETPLARFAASTGATVVTVRRPSIAVARNAGVAVATGQIRRDDFDAIGGFDERVTTVDDLDFARRLRDHGLRTGRKFVNLRQAPVTMSCRHGAAGGFSYALTR
jgi:GT2 family glycosyltransferase